MSKKQSGKSAGARGAAAQRRDPRQAETDAPPSNTASDTYRKEDGYKLLRVGIDSLYLSFHGELFEGMDSELMRRKYHAQSQHPDDKIQAQWPSGQHIFEVSDRGQGRFAYVLQDNAFRICLRSGDSGLLPMAYVKVAAEYLAHRPATEIVEELANILQDFGECDRYPMISRVDLYADFQSNTDMGALSREAWITRADGVDSYSRKGQFSGWKIGAGGAMSARLYDKTLEIQKSGKSFVLEPWRRAGWDGVSKVWRLEFQFMRQVLRELGVRSFDGLTDKLGGIWGYASNTWLRLAVPDLKDSNRGRWPPHALWVRLAAILWRLDDVPLTRTFSPARVPSLEYLLRCEMGLLTSFMATHKIRDYDQAGLLLLERCREFHDSRCKEKLEIDFPAWIDQQVSIKERRFNTRLNIPSLRKEASVSDKVDSDAVKYYKASRGE
jgi:hypothetical protein